MIRRFAISLSVAILCLPVCAQAPAEWIAASNKYTNLLLAVEMKHTPELGSNQGLSQFDTEVSQPTLVDEDQERQETEAVLATLKGAVGQQKQKEVAQDLAIVIRRIELQFKEQDFDRAHKVDYLNASRRVFSGLRVLLDEQTPAERRPGGRRPNPKICGPGTGLQATRRHSEATRAGADGQARRGLSRPHRD